MGINIEYKNTDRRALAVIFAASWLYHRLTGFEVEGSLPREGPAIVVANHTSETDVLKMAYISFTSGKRVIRGVAKRDLLDLSYNEPPEVLARTGKMGKFDLLKVPVFRQLIAFTLNGIGAISVTRGNERSIEQDRQFLFVCDEVLRSGQLLGIFPQETRVREGDLRDIKPGIGLLVRRHPAIPVLPVSISNKKVVIGNTFTYLELSENSDHRLGPKETVAIVADRIADNLSLAIRIKWQKEDRPLFLNRN